MASNLLTFRKFFNADEVDSIEAILQQYDILYEVDKYRPRFNAALGGIMGSEEYIVKIRPEDFGRVEEILRQEAQSNVEQLDSSYYLFSFSDEELFDILLKPDEWSAFDYELAKKLLTERGKSISPEELDLMRKNRIEELAKPEPSLNAWVFIGYLFAIFGGILAAFIGWHLLAHKRTLPDGTQAYAYSPSDRNHGKIMVIVGSLIFVVFLLLRAYFSIITWP